MSPATLPLTIDGDTRTYRIGARLVAKAEQLLGLQALSSNPDVFALQTNLEVCVVHGPRYVELVYRDRRRHRRLLVSDLRDGSVHQASLTRWAMLPCHQPMPFGDRCARFVTLVRYRALIRSSQQHVVLTDADPPQ